MLRNGDFAGRDDDVAAVGFQVDAVGNLAARRSGREA